jgi:hypothetical protein
MDCIGNNQSERINAFEEEMNVKTSIQSIWGVMWYVLPRQPLLTKSMEFNFL